LTGSEGFAELYDAAFSRLVGQLFLITGDLHEAEDVVQEAFTRAAMRWRRLAEYDVPETWVRRVAINLARDRFRHRRRGLLAWARVERRDASPATADNVSLADVLAGLSWPQREVVVLHHLLDLPVEEVAVQLGIPAGTVKSRLARARAVLARRLGDELEEVAAWMR
jgi:RNA polymerase sigma-70 factor, ECF subfamily